jgi:hypothetical protein
VNAVQRRILRRARPYSPPYVAGDSADRGLVGYFIGASIANQFHFVMQSWITQGDFNPNTDYSPNNSGYDPLFGPSTVPPPFTPPTFDYCLDGEDPTQASSYRTVPTPPAVMPQLVITKGGLYVFFPSITALGLMADGKIAAS